MCGIAGIIHTDREKVASRLHTMTESLLHRGPDASGEYIDRMGQAWIGLGHRRLSIIDLSPLGKQPMATADGNGVIVFNGEIYNYQRLRRGLEKQGCVFKGGSDTEVLLNGLALYGKDFVRQLEGMYAFAFYDRLAQKLLLGRDPLGIKPLYLYRDEEFLLFASELKAIRNALDASKPKISSFGLMSFLAYGAVAQPSSILEHVTSLDAGSTLEIVATGNFVEAKQPETWWSMPKPSTWKGSSAEAVAETERLIHSAISDHLIADVPVGVFLSAGIDSSIIATIAHSCSADVRAFTVTLSHDEELDELSIARATAKRIGMEHVAVRVSEENAEQLAREWLTSADQPSIDGLNTFIISKAVREYGIKVALSGLGADELFGGYPSFTEVPTIAKYARALNRLPMFARQFACSIAGVGRSQEVSEKLAGMLLSENHTISDFALSRRRLMSDRQLKMLGLVHENQRTGWLDREARKWLVNKVDSPGWEISNVESRYYQGNTLLRDSDVNSMAHSLEIRVPFLDQRLLDWVPCLPDEYRFPKGHKGKYLLRQAGKAALDKVHLSRPKSGFVLPLARWMQATLKPVCTQAIDTLCDSGLLNANGVRAIWNGFLEEKGSRASTRALALVTLGAYLSNMD